MESATEDKKIQEALSAVGQYLSDTIAPLQVAESIVLLAQQPPQLVIPEILGWISAQYKGNQRSVSVADYLFHSVTKLNNLANLQLVPTQVLEPYINSVEQLLLEHCPPAEKRLLVENFNRIGKSETSTTVPIHLIYRQARPSESESEIRETAASDQSKDHLISILWDRLKSEAEHTWVPAGNENNAETVPHLVATAASSTHTGDEFRKLQENLNSLGMGSRTDQIFRMLSHSLPGWMIPSTGTDAAKSSNPSLQAMQQIIGLAEDRREGCRRFQELVQAAVDQFNAGSLARAATMFDLALGLSFDQKLDTETLSKTRKTGHRALNINQLRSLAKNRDKHALLLKVLDFFEEFSAKNLLDSLEYEDKREQRWLILGLLEAHGNAARKLAFQRLKEIRSATNVAIDWHFARNLVYLLNVIPRSEEFSVKEEMELVIPLLRLSLPSPLIKEAIKHAGKIKCPETEDLLITTADTLERLVIESASSGRDPKQRISILDRVIFTLAFYGTPKGYRKAVEHGLSNRSELGETAARLEYLSSQNLSEEKESLALLIRCMKSKVPRKLFGMTIQKNDQLLNHIVVALSATPAPIVLQSLKDIAERFPLTKSGRSAAAALRGFEALEKPQIQQGHTMTGDLELFGLPDLLQQLNHLQATGVLTLKDLKGNPMGTFSLLAGSVENSSTGRLAGVVAAYQLLEKPTAGTFVFQGQKTCEEQESSSENKSQDLNSILSEGMRRYDELERARAIVPDFSLLKRTGINPASPAKEEHAEFFETVWQKTETGVTPEECEAICAVDSYRVRSLLARWVEEGSLTVE
jgi:hypothetical protein